MAKTQTVRVVQGRMQFRCYKCRARRMIGVAPQVRRRAVKCHKCGEISRCTLNRRMVRRDQQYGKVLVSSSDGTNIEVSLFDISLHGVGFEVPIQLKNKIKVGKIVEFKCPWNPRLLSSGTYQIKVIQGQRVGAEKTRKSEWNV